ncbi:MAG: HAD-IIA family hydrolase [Chloroflexota bacterium]
MGIILDMDGVLWQGPALLPGFHGFFQFLDQASIPYVFATNNSSSSVNQYVQRLEGLGVYTESERVITSGVVAADYLTKAVPAGSRVCVIGETGLFESVTSNGFVVADEDAKALVVGLDREINYAKLANAMKIILNGALFVGTNPDPTLPHKGLPLPGTGAILAAISKSTGVDPIIVGKPETHMLTHALSVLGVKADDALMVGDRLETDILGAQRAGIPTALLLSGVTSESALNESNIKPDSVFRNLEDLTSALARS